MRNDEAQDALWAQHLAAHRAAIHARKPDAIDRIKLEIRKLEAELGPVARRRALAGDAQAAGRAVAPSLIATLDARGAELRERMAELRTIVRGVKAAPVADEGATPQLAVRPLPSSDVPEELMDTAMDLRCGWMVRTSGLAASISAYDEMRIVGSPGETADRLERAYATWHAEMLRLRLLAWPTILVVCEGKSLIEAARLRKLDPRAIGHLMACGLIIYQGIA